MTSASTMTLPERPANAPVVRTAEAHRPAPSPRPRRPGRYVVALLAIVVWSLAAAVLHRELETYRLGDIAAAVATLPLASIAAALALTVLDYVVLFWYDALALRYVRCRLPARRIALASALGYAVSHLLSYAALTGGSVRYRLWSAWGLSREQIARAVTFIVLTNALGIAATAGAALTIAAGLLPLPATIPEAVLRAAGVVLLAAVLVYAGWIAVGRGRLRVARWRVDPPAPRLAMAQLVVAAMDWTLAGAVLYSLLPAAHGLSFPLFLASFLIAQGIGILSYVPGGIGVFDAAIVVLLRDHVVPADAIGALIAYRAVYYLLPFSIALTVLGAYEIRQRRARIGQLLGVARRTLSTVAPTILSVATFLAGAVLLASGAMPPLPHRVAWLHVFVPRGVIEVSHFTASLVGAGLLVLAIGLRRRMDSAFHLTVAGLVAGIAASLLKGLDWEEALILATVLAALLAARRQFYRQAVLTSEPWSPAWSVAILVVLWGSIWLGVFSHRHVAYSHDLWWQFALHGDASPFLRASVGAIVLIVAVGLRRLVSPVRRSVPRPSPAELDRAASIAYQSERASSYLASLGDKALLFGESGGLLMYAVAGRSWIALGDPVGTPAERRELAWRFKEMADRYDGWPVFYEVGREDLSLYLDLGLRLFKLGEEGRVPLATFSLDGGARREIRRTMRDVDRNGGAFEIVPPERVATILPELRRVSDAWLASKHAREKGFSLGYFDETYLRRFPIAVVRSGDRIVAFANVWLGATREELSLDLMRYEPAAPHGSMQYIFIHLMLWGQAQGYRWFNVGMAPLSGFERRALAPLWSRVGALVYSHAERFYNFRGLRQYKEKFDPVWEPKYLASPGGLALPRILLNAATLISRGLGGVVSK
jgi:phosphatidylglycerol lysyltransferase